MLTERIRHLLVDRGYEPKVVTAVAYNVMAAEQLRERTAGFQPTIRTLNSLGLNVCSRRGDWRIAEEPFCREVLSGLVKTARKVGTDPLAPYLDALATIRLGLVPPEKAEDLHPDAAGIAAAFPAYRDVLHGSGRLDFDEQIYRAIELLLADPDLRAEVRAEARTLLVDEFQDLTPAHLLLIRLVAGPAADVFGVGDDDQVIYGYAGADPGFLIDYRRYFPGAATYDLQVNYRCPPAVVDAARTLLAHNRRRIAKTIHAATPGSPQAPQRTGRRDDADGRDQVARTVPPWRARRPGCRRPTTWARRRSRSCGSGRRPGSPYRRHGGAHPGELVAAAGSAAARPRPGSRTGRRSGRGSWSGRARPPPSPTCGSPPIRLASARADLRATVRRPSRKISPKAIDMLARDAVTSLRSIRGLAEWLADKDAFVKDVDRVEGYAADLEALAEAMSKPGTTTADLLRFIRDTIGLGEAMETLDASKGALDRSSNGDDLAALLQVAPLHPDAATFEAWLQQALAAGRTRHSSGGDEAGSGEQGVHLATVHRVKGREWRGSSCSAPTPACSPTGSRPTSRRRGGSSTSPSPGPRSRRSCWPTPPARHPSSRNSTARPPPHPTVDPNDPNPFRKLTMPPAPAPTTKAARGTAKAKAKSNGEPGLPADEGR